jgi:hypothetical protein
VVDDGVLCPERNWNSESESNDGEVLPFNEEEGHELAGVVEEGQITPPRERLYLRSI